MKKLLIALAVAAIGLTPLPLAKPAEAAGNGLPTGAKREYSFNLIGKPGDHSGGCGQGHRIFVNRDASNIRILVTDTGEWAVEDCDATGGNLAVLDVDADPGRYDVYVRILGKPGGELTLCADFVSDAGGQLCLLDSFTLNREGGQSKFQVRPDSLFDASLEDILWTLSTNKDFRIAQFVVVSLPS